MEFKKLILIMLSLFLSSAIAAHDRLKLEYVENNGQWHNNVLFRASCGSGAIFLEHNSISYSFYDSTDLAQLHEYSQWTQEEQEAFTMGGHSWKMNFVESRISKVNGEKIQDHYYNYFLGNDPAKWASNVKIYEAVKYSGVYEGVDLRCYNRGSNFKYDFIVSPGAKDDAIRLSFDGLDNVEIVDGALVLSTSIGKFKEATPFAYQLIDNRLHEVKCEYEIRDDEVGFKFAEGYDREYALIIDPELIAATLSGSSSTNYGHTATFDSSGGIYTGAVSFGAGYPTTTGAFQENFMGGIMDIAISHLSPDGNSLIWASYIGGSESEHPHSLVCSSAQELYVYGSTNSADFPTTTGAFDESHNGGTDILISKFSSDGSELIGSTYLGGSDEDGRNILDVNYGDRYKGEIILDQTENPVLVSYTSSANFPTSSGVYQNELAGNQDALVVRLNSTLTNIEVSTFLGSTENDSGYGIRIMESGEIVVVGTAGGNSFPITAGAYQTDYLGGAGTWGDDQYDGFITILNSSATTLLSSTFFGTDAQDQVFFVDLDSEENLFIYGQGGVDIPIVGNVYSTPNSRQFISKISSDLSTLMLSTQIGSEAGAEEAYDFIPVGFMVDSCDNVYISGHGTWEDELPTTSDALFGIGEGGFYLAQFSKDLEDLQYGSLLAGTHVDGGTSRFSKSGIVYQAVCSGGEFVSTDDAWAADQIGAWDIGIWKLGFEISCPCPGDFNGDGYNDAYDLLLFLGNFGCLSDCIADMNNDGVADTSDLLTFIAGFGASCD